MAEIKFQKYAVVSAGMKARVHYSLDNRTDGRKCVTIYAKDYSDKLYLVLPQDYTNNTDLQTDYFEKGTVRLFEDSPYYPAARARAEQNAAEWDAKYERRAA